MRVGTVAGMAEVTARPASSTDAAQIAGLIQAVAVAAGERKSVSANDIAAEFAQSYWDPTVDSRVVEEDGHLIAYASVIPPAAGGSRVGADEYVQDPRRGVRRALVQWQIERTRELRDGAGSSESWSLVIQGRSDRGGTDELLEELGFELIRHTFHMRRSTATPAPDVPVPDGLVVRAYASSDEVALYRVHNDAYADRWGFEPRPFRDWASGMAHPSFRPAASFVALDQDGDIVSYLLAFAANEPGLLTVGPIGTVRTWRGRGTASVLLARAVGVAAASKVATVDLSVDAASPTGAVGVYLRMGFETARTSTIYERSFD